MTSDSERIRLAHGAGGLEMQRLIREVIFRELTDPELQAMDDAAELEIDGSRLAFTTDAFVVKPIFFPGGDIGSLAVSGTVNDLLMKGARPQSLSLSLILEEGFLVADLKRILASINRTSRQAGVKVVTGDTKVVARGEADGLFVNTSGVGPVLPNVHVSGRNAQPGDAVLVSGSVGRHGIAVMAERNGLTLTGDIQSDAAPLTSSVLPLLEQFPDAVHVLRDPTRGGLAATLGEIAASSEVSMMLDEAAVPIDESVAAVCNLLGFDPLYLPSEGRFLAVVAADAAPAMLDLLRTSAGCSDAACIGEVTPRAPGEVLLKTRVGGRRLLDIPAGELLPRIC